MKNLTTIALKRRGAIYISGNEKMVETPILAMFVHELNNLGYSLSTKGLHTLLKQGVSLSTLVDVLGGIKEAVSIPEGDVLYPNFPKEVENTSELKLLIDAVIYAMTGFEVMPEANPEFDRLSESYETFKKEKTLDVVSDKEMKELFLNMLKSKVAMSSFDYEDLEVLLKTYGKELKDEEIPVIPFKETMARVFFLFRDLGLKASVIKTPTDMLRVLQFKAEGLTDLKGHFALPRFDEETKALIVSAMSSVKFNAADVMKYKEEWKHIFRFVSGVKHQEEYKEYLSRKKKVETFEAREEKLFAGLLTFCSIRDENNIHEMDALNLIKAYVEHVITRPSDYIRKMNKVLSSLKLTLNEQSYILMWLVDAVTKAEPRVSIQYYNSLDRRGDARGVFYGGYFHKLEEAIEFDNDLTNTIKKCILLGLKNHFEENKTADQKMLLLFNNLMERVPVGVSNRLAGENFSGLSSGATMELPKDANYFRLFTAWTVNTDIDLSAQFLDENFATLDVCSFFSLKNEFSFHSGDIRQAGREFIDIDLEKLREKHNNARYIIVQYNDYSGNLSDGKVSCGLSLLKRKDRQKGEIFKEKEVLVSAQMSNSKAANILAFVVDLEKNGLLWIDSPISKARFGTHVLTDAKTKEAIIKYWQAPTFNVAQLVDTLKLAGAIDVVSSKDEIAEDEERELVEIVTLNSDGTYVVKHDVIAKLIS